MTPDLTFPTDRSLTVDTDDGARLAVEVAGDGRLVVVLHGTLVSSAVMGPLARRLVAEGYAVAARDLRGHGRSTVGRERFSIRGYGRDLSRVIETLAPDAYVLVGHSSGGMGGSGRSSPRTRRRPCGPRPGLLDFDLTPELDRVTMPVLVLQGGRDTSVRPVLARELVARLPNARYIAHPDCGHMLVLERTESVAREIAAFARSSLG